MIRSLINLLLDLLGFVFEKVSVVAQKLFDKFIEVNIFEKIIVVMTLPSFLCVVLPVARYYIFEEYFTINNPMAVHLIGIVAVMLVTVYFNNLISCIGRVLYNSYYLGWIIYLGVTHTISGAPYELMPAYYLSILIPVVYAVCAVLSYLLFRDR